MDCLAQIDPRFADYCRLAVEGNDTDRRHIVDRAKIGTTPLPGLVRQAVNLAGAVVQHVVAGAPPASEEERERRLAICRANTCGFYREIDRCAHAKCGCHLEIKASWADQRCPLDPPRWGPIVRTAQASQTRPGGEPRAGGEPATDPSPGRSQGDAGGATKGVNEATPTAITSVDERPVAPTASSDRGAR
jgi:hypothetical protein